MSIPQQIISEFLDFIKYQKRYSLHTIISYENDLQSFFIFVKQEFDVDAADQITSAMVRSWLASLKNADMTAKSINRKISTLKSFYKFLLREGKIIKNPVTAISSLKMPKRLPSFIEEKDINTLFRHVEFPDTWEGETDKLLLQIFYQTGIRLSELINLKVSQIDAGNNHIKVLGKGNKERIVPVNNELLNSISQYIKNKQNIEKADQQVLLVGTRGKKLYAKYVYATVKKYLGSVTTNERKSPHILRHTFATHLTNNGADINAIKELLGHSSLAATQIYTNNSIEKLKDIHKKSHPKA